MKFLRSSNLYLYIQKAIDGKQAIRGFEFFIAFLLLVAYMSTNPYIYGWDDQHLEIPILKHLIDPSMYKGDYYVESATKYFTCWLYPILAKLITVRQMPAAYFILYVVSRYAMFYWVLRLWFLISGSYFTAICVSFSFFLLGRTDEFLYRSFCHEEFSFIFMFAGLYCFYRERYLAAALIFGLGVNFHAIYNLFPMLYMLVYLIFFHPRRFKAIFQAGLIFVGASLPFLLWQIPISLSREVANPVPASEWLPLYLLSCYQNFLFGFTPLKEVLSNAHAWWTNAGPYLFLMGLYVFHLVFNPLLRRDRKLHAIMGLSWILLVVVYFFDYVHPNRFAVDLNLQRVEQYMRFFVMGYTTVWACNQLHNSKPWSLMAAAVLTLACGTTDLIGLFFLGIVAMIFTVDAMVQPPLRWGRTISGGVFLLALGVLLYSLGLELRTAPQLHVYWGRFKYVIAAMCVVFLALSFQKNNQWLRRLLIIVPLIGSLIICIGGSFEYSDLMKTGPSGWQLERNWLDMQYYVRDHTPKDAMILTPYDVPMGGFRIHSERKVLVCYRDCGIIGFDYAAAVEWKKRIKDIESFKIFSNKGGEDQAVMTAIVKYNVNYVVFMKYYGPDGDTAVLKKMYENEAFSLFQVT